MPSPGRGASFSRVDKFMPQASSFILVTPISPEFGDDETAMPEIVQQEAPAKPEPPKPESPESSKSRLAELQAKYGDELGFILDPPVEYQGRTVEFISIEISKLRKFSKSARPGWLGHLQNAKILLRSPK